MHPKSLNPVLPYESTIPTYMQYFPSVLSKFVCATSNFQNEFPFCVLIPLMKRQVAGVMGRPLLPVGVGRRLSSAPAPSPSPASWWPAGVPPSPPSPLQRRLVGIRGGGLLWRRIWVALPRSGWCWGLVVAGTAGGPAKVVVLLLVDVLLWWGRRAPGGVG